MIAAVLAWVSQQDAKALIIGAGVIAASLAAVIALFRQPAVSRPIRWFGRVVITDPLSKVVRQALDEWAHTPDGPVDKIDRRLASLEVQNVRNGGSSNRDRMNAIASAVGAAPDPVRHPDA